MILILLANTIQFVTELLKTINIEISWNDDNPIKKYFKKISEGTTSEILRFDNWDETEVTIYDNNDIAKLWKKVSKLTKNNRQLKDYYRVFFKCIVRRNDLCRKLRPDLFPSTCDFIFPDE